MGCDQCVEAKVAANSEVVADNTEGVDNDNENNNENDNENNNVVSAEPPVPKAEEPPTERMDGVLPVAAGSFEGRKFEGSNKNIRNSRLYFDGHSSGTPGVWLTASVFACSPCPFGNGTWAVACSDEGTRTCYLANECGIPDDADVLRRVELVAKIQQHAGHNILNTWN